MLHSYGNDKYKAIKIRFTHCAKAPYNIYIFLKRIFSQAVITDSILLFCVFCVNSSQALYWYIFDLCKVCVKVCKSVYFYTNTLNLNNNSYICTVSYGTFKKLLLKPLASRRP